MYTLEFEANELGEQRYAICTQAILMTNKEVTRDNEDDFIEVLRKLKKIGIKDEDKIIGGVNLYDLAEGGGTVHLERSEHKLLLDCIKRPIWRPVILEQKKEVEKWVEGLKKEPGSLAKDAKPEEKKRALELAESGD